MLAPELKALLLAELRSPVYAGLSESEAFGRLNDPQPVTGTRAKPLTVAGVMSLLSPASVAKLLPLPCLIDVRDKIQGQDRDGVALWAQVLAMGAVITAEEAGSVVASLEATEVVDAGTLPPRINTEFGGVPGMPNRLKPEVFAELWAEVAHG